MKSAPEGQGRRSIRWGKRLLYGEYSGGPGKTSKGGNIAPGGEYIFASKLAEYFIYIHPKVQMEPTKGLYSI